MLSDPAVEVAQPPAAAITMVRLRQRVLTLFTVFTLTR
jgi:hypothetical protein